MTYLWQGEFSFDGHANFFLPSVEIFHQNLNLMTKLYIFSKKNSQKVCGDMLNAVLTTLPKGPVNVQYKSRKIRSATFSVHLTENPWAGAFPFWWTHFFSRKPEFFRQEKENGKIFAPTGFFSHSPKLKTKSYLFFKKLFLPKVPQDTTKAFLKTLPEKKCQKAESLPLMI